LVIAVFCEPKIAIWPRSDDCKPFTFHRNDEFSDDTFGRDTSNFPGIFFCEPEITIWTRSHIIQSAIGIGKRVFDYLTIRSKLTDLVAFDFGEPEIFIASHSDSTWLTIRCRNG